MADDLIQDWKGVFEMTMIGGPLWGVKATFRGAVTDMRGFVMYFVGEDGIIYNWSTITMIRKVR